MDDLIDRSLSCRPRPPRPRRDCAQREERGQGRSEDRTEDRSKKSGTEGRAEGRAEARTKSRAGERTEKPAATRAEKGVAGSAPLVLRRPPVLWARHHD